MQWTSLNDLREKYLSFFESKGHLRLPSFPLVPQGDKSLLLINSGMAPMKKFFTGEVEPPRHRVTTCQKCIRTPDLERVGHTARHGTFFEMLGNFSFGDYFKEQAIPWAWEFLTKTLEIPEEKLYPSIFENDEEAFAIWQKVGVPASRITRLGREDNFWEHGTGPCGPCSEIYFDRGLKYGCGRPECGPGCDCDRFMEIWNNVFSQFNSDGKGNYTELATKNIDTGMGLERLACVMQGVDNMFEVDTNRAILDKVCTIAGKKYGVNAENDISIRVCTDHIKSAMFMIADGVIPSNEGRGYVLRRIIRRACRHGKLLGINHPFLTDLCAVAVQQNEGAYPELREKYDYVLKILSLEEERFDATIDAGLSILSGLVEKAKEANEKQISGEDAFKLYDTFGFPVDLTKEIALEAGLTVDDEAFASLMQAQKTRARQARANISGWNNMSKTVLSELPKTSFVGYTADSCTSRVIAILTDEGKVDSISEGDCSVILDQTTFYGEGGGQVGDCGTLTCASGAVLSVFDTQKTDGVYIHLANVQTGVLHVGDTVEAAIDSDRRNAIRRNHSSVHLLQAALRTVLGNHVEQAGSYVDAERARFDFTHFQPMTKEEIEKVEAIVNANILRAVPVETIETDLETAKKNGAMALFGEKYGSVVRMVKMGDCSTELCGGTHVGSTGNIGLFKILSESSVAAGVRRIEGTSGLGVLQLLADKEALIYETASALKVNNPADIAGRASALQSELGNAKKTIESLQAKMAMARMDSLLSEAKTVGSVSLIAADLGDMNPETARSLCDSFKEKNSHIVCVFAVHSGERLNFIGACGSDAVSAGVHCGKLMGAVAAVTGGKGGGRPDSAMSGGKDLTKIQDALEQANAIVSTMIKN